MASISIKDFDDNLYAHLKIEAAKARIPLRSYITRLLVEGSHGPLPDSGPNK